MRRWHLTLALVVAVVMWRWSARPSPAPAPVVAEVVSAPVPVGDGLAVSAGFDRPAVLASGGPQTRRLVVTLAAPASSARGGMDLSVVLDTSASMGVADKLPQARRAAVDLARSLAPADRYALTVFADDATALVPLGPVDDADRLAEVLRGVYQGGGTNLYAGLERAANELRAAPSAGARARRLLVVSDGEANVGVTDDGTLVRLAQDLEAQGISVSTVGLGRDFDEDLLQRLADAGGGEYSFVDDASDLERAFAAERDHAAGLVAHGARLEVTPPAGMTLLRAIGWDAELRDGAMAVLVGDLAAGQERKVVVEVEVEPHAADAITVRAQWRDPSGAEHASPEARASARAVEDPRAVEAAGDPALRAAAARAEASSLLRESADAYALGLRPLAADLAARAGDALRGAGLDAAVADDARAAYERTPPDGEGGRREIKANKERARDLAR